MSVATFSDVSALGLAIADLAQRAQPSVVEVQTGPHGAGAGVVWSADGVIMTNQHVVAQHDHATIRLHDGRELQGEVIARDPVLDLAALRVSADKLQPALAGPSEQVRVGELVVAIGHPWGQRYTVTAGIVSALGAIEVGWRRSPAAYIRSDVQLAPGNSGGPLLDASGRVIGINAMIFGGDLAVAIPAHIVGQFLAVARQPRPVLGVSVQDVELPADLATIAQQRAGLLIVAVDPEGMAARHGVVIGDVLVALNGQPLADAHSLRYVLHAANDQLTLNLLRAGALRTIRIGAPSTEAVV